MKTDTDRPTIRLHIRPGKVVIGGADIGAAITARNSALADDVAVALRKAGYASGMLVLDANESLELGPGN